MPMPTTTEAMLKKIRAIRRVPLLTTRKPLNSTHGTPSPTSSVEMPRRPRGIQRERMRISSKHPKSYRVNRLLSTGTSTTTIPIGIVTSPTTRKTLNSTQKTPPPTSAVEMPGRPRAIWMVLSLTTQTPLNSTQETPSTISAVEMPREPKGIREERMRISLKPPKSYRAKRIFSTGTPTTTVANLEMTNPIGMVPSPTTRKPLNSMQKTPVLTRPVATLNITRAIWMVLSLTTQKPLN